jgi:hypothetical protein
MIEWWRDSVYAKLSRIEGFMAILMKPRNGLPWTDTDRAFLRYEMRAVARWIPAFFIFLLPGGMFLLPAYAWLLDRRQLAALRLLDQNRRPLHEESEGERKAVEAVNEKAS